MGISLALEHVPQGTPAQRTSRGCVDKQRSVTICASRRSARSIVMVGSQGLCLFRAWSTGTTEKPALFKPKLSLAEPAQSSKAIGLSDGSWNEDGAGKGDDTGCEGTSEESLKSLLTGTCDEALKFSPLVGRTMALSALDAPAMAKVCKEKFSGE